MQHKPTKFDDLLLAVCIGLLAVLTLVLAGLLYLEGDPPPDGATPAQPQAQKVYDKR